MQLITWCPLQFIIIIAISILCLFCLFCLWVRASERVFVRKYLPLIFFDLILKRTEKLNSIPINYDEWFSNALISKCALHNSVLQIAMLNSLLEQFQFNPYIHDINYKLLLESFWWVLSCWAVVKKSHHRIFVSEWMNENGMNEWMDWMDAWTMVM